MQAVKPLNPEISLNNNEKLNTLILHHECIYLQKKNLYSRLSVISADIVMTEYFRH
jgi:hypothetical protein